MINLGSRYRASRASRFSMIHFERRKCMSMFSLNSMVLVHFDGRFVVHSFEESKYSDHDLVFARTLAVVGCL